ncbi:MAG: SUMF1/EgtB/PvdO family nonheme iron enzyme [Chloroflexi bacterium]|nr:SUMF1/EgtB/PvdO family nonheme iron enzyme [Chloroflexota bacterium]
MAKERQHPWWRRASALTQIGDAAARGPRSRGRAATVRVVRGGSWNNNQRNARCAYRNRNVSDNYNTNIGFRVVVSITSSQWLVNLVVYGRGTAPKEDDSVARPRSRPLAWHQTFEVSKTSEV